MSAAQPRRLTIVQVAVLAFGAALCAMAVASASPRTTFLQPPNAAAPPGSLRMAVVVLMIGMIYFWNGLVSVAVRRFGRPGASSLREVLRPKLRRPANSSGGALLRWQMVLAVWIFVVAYPNAWTWETVGFRSSGATSIGFCAGVFVYALFVAVLSLCLRAVGGLEKFADDYVRTMAGIWPRPPRQKAAAWAAFCMFNPVIEELLFRGVLVYQTALVFGSPWWPIAAGLVVNMGTHWYQGARSMRVHVPFYFIAVALLFSPLGLAGAIGFHVAGDVVPMALFRRQLREFRQRHRRSNATVMANKQVVAAGA